MAFQNSYNPDTKFGDSIKELNAGQIEMKMNNLGIIKQIKLQRAITYSIDEFKLDENYFYDTESQELYEIGLQRQIDVKGLDKIFLDAMDLSKIRKFWKIDEVTAVHLDGYIGIHLHNLLRLSTAEASRPELGILLFFKYQT